MQRIQGYPAIKIVCVHKQQGVDATCYNMSYRDYTNQYKYTLSITNHSTSKVRRTIVQSVFCNDYLQYMPSPLGSAI